MLTSIWAIAFRDGSSWPGELISITELVSGVSGTGRVGSGLDAWRVAKFGDSVLRVFIRLVGCTGRDACRSVCRWRRLGPSTSNPILTPGPKGSWDAGAIETMTVVKVGGSFHLYYEGWALNANGGLGAIQIGHATSPDGVHWMKDPANPVLPKGNGTDLDSNGTWDPSVIYEQGLFKMWYGGSTGRRFDWGYATSVDGVHFDRHGQLSRLGEVEDYYVIHDQTSGR